MRTTIQIDDDVAAEVARLRRVEGVGLSEAVNRLARRGMAELPGERPRFVQRSADLRARVDLRNIGEVLDLLDDGETDG